MTTTGQVEVWRDPNDVLREALDMIEEWRADARRRRRNRRIAKGLGAFLGVFLAFLGVIMAFNKSTGTVAASETLPPPVSVPLAPEFQPSRATELVPEEVTTSTAPLPTQIRVLVPGYDGLGQILTDGRLADRVMPGEPCRSVIAIPFDPSSAGTVIVGSAEWRVKYRGKVSASGLERITEVCPEQPTVYVVSALPGDPRPFVEATR